MGNAVIGGQNRGFQNLLDHERVARLEIFKIHGGNLESRVKCHANREFRDPKPRGLESLSRLFEVPVELIQIAFLFSRLKSCKQPLLVALEPPGLNHHADDGVCQLSF